MKKTFKIKLMAALLLSTLALSGCSLSFGKKTQVSTELPPAGQETVEQTPGEVPPEIQKSLDDQSKIKKFKDYEELAAFLDEGPAASNYAYYGDVGFGGGIRREMLVKSVAPTASIDNIGLGMAQEETAVADGGSDDFSQTNVQVEGVDESDIVKSDGEYVYAVSNNDLFIIKAFPADKMEVVSKISFESRPQDIYISGDRLAIFGNNQVLYKSDLYRNFRRQSPFSFLKIFDIKDKKNPRQLRSLDFEGNYFNSRLIGDYIYFVTNNYNYYYLPTDPIIPRLLEDGEAVSSKCEGTAKCFAPEVYYFDIPYDSYNFTQVSSINIKNPEENVKGEIYVLSGGQNMYVSPSNIYIAYTKYVSEYQLTMMVLKEMVLPKLAQSQQDKIKEIEAAKNYILSENEKMSKIAAIVERYMSSLSDDDQDKLQKELEAKMKEKYQSIAKEMEKTVIHKISINKGELSYKAFGEVTGSVLNQFSMDESNGYFRLATTKNRTWSQYAVEDEKDSYSNVYVLDENMKTVGSLEGLARGERIYSARFMGSRAYLVTFVQTDPLFTIDLSNPSAPKVLGELKIPGFSTYLHPYSDNLLIGFGKDAVASEWGGARTKGLKLSLFDVSDVANPKEVDTYVVGDAGSDSIALNDHKAFLFSKEKNLLSIPATITEDKNGQGWGQMVFSGALVFHVDETGFELKGKIDHSDGGKTGIQDCWWGYCYYDNNVLRSLYIGDNLYTYSNKYLKANSLDDLKELKNLELKKERSGGDDFIIVN
jgi:inhibitor of cysteine peptidase